MGDTKKLHQRLADLVGQMETLARATGSDRAARLSKLGDELKALYDPNSPDFEFEDDDELEAQVDAAWETYSQVNASIEASVTAAGPNVIAQALEKNQPDVLVSVGSDEAFDAALRRAIDEVGKNYWATQPKWVFASAALATTPARKTRMHQRFAEALRSMIASRLAEGDLINQVAFAALSAALAKTTPLAPVARAALVEALDFCRHERRHFEAMTCAGTRRVGRGRRPPAVSGVAGVTPRNIEVWRDSPTWVTRPVL